MMTLITGVFKAMFSFVARRLFVTLFLLFLLQWFPARGADNRNAFFGGVSVGLALSGVGYLGVRWWSRRQFDPDKPMPCSEWHPKYEKWKEQQERERAKKGNFGGGRS